MNLFRLLRSSPSSKEFADYWRACPPNDLQRRLLMIHYSSPEKNMRPAYMAECMGWRSQDAAHLHYGTFAGMTAKGMGVDLRDGDNVYLFCTFRGGRGDIRWRMRRQVRAAIEALGYCDI